MYFRLPTRGASPSEATLQPMFSTPWAACAALNIISSDRMTSFRMRQKTKEQSAKKALAIVRKEMARPRVAQSAQKTVAKAATAGIPHFDSN
jgi:hypothetical protein